jgi:hypothetical protein
MSRRNRSVKFNVEVDPFVEQPALRIKTSGGRGRLYLFRFETALL